jgi:elongation factor G
MHTLPRVAYINKLDRVGADFDKSLKSIINKLNGCPLAISRPIGGGGAVVCSHFVLNLFIYLPTVAQWVDLPFSGSYRTFGPSGHDQGSVLGY